MAHVKVARRSMSKEEWISLRAKWISSRVIKKSFHLEGWEIREGRQVTEMNYEFYSDDYKKIQDGEMFFSPDGTVFLRNTVTLPEELKDEEVWFQFTTASEMIIKVNGTWAGGLDPNRERMLLKKAEDKTTTFLLEMEGYNRSKPDDERNPETSHLRGCRQVFDGGNFVVINPEIQAAVYDLKILLDAMQCEYINEDVIELITRETYAALNYVDYEETDANLYEVGIRKLKEHLRTTIFENKDYGNIGNVALVAHSHLDIAYYWRKIHTVQKNARTCLIQLRLMDRYPEFKYCHTQAYTYEMLEKHFPEIFEEVKARIKEGRFEVVGGMYVEPDCNLPTAESIVRQCMYGQHYFREKFDITVDNCWLPDVFGNSWILPQILQKSGMKYFVSNKMSTWNDTNKFPHNNFIWKGIDGTEVLACVPPTHFISWNTPEQIIENWESFQDKESCNETLNMFGYGDGGSGATEEMLEFMERLPNIPSLPKTRHIRGDEFLRENLEGNDKLSVWDGELYLEMHRGTFTTRGILKKYNRELEIFLRDVEMLSSIAALKGYEYPYEIIDKCWKKVLVNQFHDILPGTHIAPVEKDALGEYKEVLSDLTKVFEEVSAFLGLHHPEGTSKRLTAVNTLGWERKEVFFIPGQFDVKTTVEGAFTQKGTLKGEEGLWVSGKKIPALGSQELVLGERQEDNVAWYSFIDGKLETPFYRAHLHEDGTLSSLYVKTDKRELVEENKKINELKIYKDNPGMYDAWDVLENYKEREDQIEVVRPLALVEAGEVYVAFEVQFKLKCSIWKQTIKFYKDDNKVSFENYVDWQETNRLAKAEFNLNILSRHAKCDTSAGTIVRETHKNTTWQQARFEVCTHKWVDLSEHGYGVALLNDGKYGVSFDKTQIGLSLLRSPIRPDLNSDKGIHTFTYVLMPHKEILEDAGIIEAAWALNTPLRFYSESKEAFEFMQIEGNNLHIQAVKRPQYAKAGEKKLILRLVELKGERGIGKVSFKLPIYEAVKVNLLEDALEEKDYSIDENSLEFKYSPFEIISFEIAF
ncbi:alpha-mannosidase [Sporanaerobium hydrogeniformans]|uniref:Alpha-mannosidase n=1 Tax=Sporanaerobium hydrogeniformans TaxID=3072179 RepID=A0AC61D6B5_9FIRM|nr:glycoside hydrolase family 38 C-terminal domain-containing protein [Sporanaerobium hydrogeniformans]PHV69256.1 alpha-mannosidase [Sporanaerobium hydrogeniformans]